MVLEENKVRFFDLLSQDELEQIHQKALEVLGKVGCIIEHQEALALLQSTGAKVDFAKNVRWINSAKSGLWPNMFAG